MSTGALILIIAQAVTFIAWAFLMFRTLFLLAGRARRESGASIPGVAASLKQWKIWLTSQDDRRARMRLALATAAVFLLTGVAALK